MATRQDYAVTRDGSHQVLAVDELSLSDYMSVAFAGADYGHACGAIHHAGEDELRIRILDRPRSVFIFQLPG